MRYKKRFIYSTIFLILLIFLFILVGLSVGTSNISFARVIQTLLGNGINNEEFIIKSVRLPRIITSMIVGGALACSGAIMQGVTGNPLASPGIIGITSGASLGIIINLYLWQSQGTISIISLPLSAVIGGVTSFIIIYSLSLKHRLSPYKLVLNGIAINACINAIIVTLSLRLTPTNHTIASAILNGSLTNISWDVISVSAVLIIILFFYCLYKVRYLNILSLGDELALGLGVSLENERKKMLLLTVAFASIAAWTAGNMSFVGLLAPHIARKLVGSNYNRLLSTSALVGMLLVLISDTIARTIISPEVLPVGIVVSIIGAPYMLYLLFKQST